jgi:hypothetical protein
MRKPLLLLAGLLLPLAPALAQNRTQSRPQTVTPPAAPKLTLTAEHRAQLEQAVTRGRMLALVDRAGYLSRRDMLTRVPNAAEAGIEGWIAEPEGNTMAVTYYAKQGDGYAAIYKAQVLGGRVVSPQVFPAGNRPLLTGAAARMAAAGEKAETLNEQKPCNGPAFNRLVLPPEANGRVNVYRMSPRMAPDRLPGGGYFRVAIGPDGGIAEANDLAGTCTNLPLPPVAAGQRPRPLVVNARDALLPNELHVFLSLWTQRPVVVATGTEQVRLWAVNGTGIAELPQ